MWIWSNAKFVFSFILFIRRLEIQTFEFFGVKFICSWYICNIKFVPWLWCYLWIVSSRWHFEGSLFSRYCDHGFLCKFLPFFLCISDWQNFYIIYKWSNVFFNHIFQWTHKYYPFVHHSFLCIYEFFQNWDKFNTVLYAVNIGSVMMFFVYKFQMEGWKSTIVFYLFNIAVTLFFAF